MIEGETYLVSRDIAVLALACCQAVAAATRCSTGRNNNTPADQFVPAATRAGGPKHVAKRVKASSGGVPQTGSGRVACGRATRRQRERRKRRHGGAVAVAVADAVADAVAVAVAVADAVAV